MKDILWMVGGICAATAGFLVWGLNRTPSVELLANHLEDEWVDRRTVVKIT